MLTIDLRNGMEMIRQHLKLFTLHERGTDIDKAQLLSYARDANYLKYADNGRRKMNLPVFALKV